MLGLPEVAIGTIVAAIIAGIVSLLGLIISKEQKVSEFRQAWIDALRKEVSALISYANAIHGASSQGRPQWTDVREDFIGINEATANIRLRLNFEEASSLEILRRIEDMEKIFSPENSPIDSGKLNKTEKELVRVTKIVLHREWTRVKKGEPFYKIARYTSLSIVILFTISCVIVFIMAYLHFLHW